MKVIEKVVSVFGFMLIAWLLFSIVSVCIHNVSGGYEYSNLNFFTVLINIAEML